MTRCVKIKKGTTDLKNYYLIDANFLANKFIKINTKGVIFTNNAKEKDNIKSCQEWWKYIDKELKNRSARIYIPDLCIAESFKVLSKKYYRENVLSNTTVFNRAKKELQNFISNSNRKLKLKNRNISVHDISTTRDLIISVDRFYEIFSRQNDDDIKKVKLVDLLLVATAKYLIDFFDIPKERLYIITSDNGLVKGIRKIGELKNAYNPYKDKASKIFESKSI